jgi:hypothetical protein
MKIRIKTIHDKYDLEYNSNIITTNNIIDKMSELEKINKENIVLYYDNNTIRYSLNELKIDQDCVFFMLVYPS